MKILIVCLPRTGSTSFLYKIGNQYSLKPMFEPFIKNIPSTYFFKKDDIVVKTAICQSPVDVNFVSISDWYADFCKHFDKVYLLSRKDLIKCAESLAYYLYYKDTTKFNFSYKTEYMWEKTPNYEETEQFVFNMHKDLEDLSKKIGVDIIYYEDIYKDSTKKLRKGNKTEPKNIV